MNHRGWSGLLSLVFLASCNGISSYATRDVSRDFKFPQNPDYGLVIVSTRVEGDIFIHKAFFPRKDDEDVGASALLLFYSDGHSPGQSKVGVIPAENAVGDFDFHDPPGYLSIRKVGAGEVQYLRTTCSTGRRPIGKGHGAPFTVEAGKAIYLGEVHIGRACVTTVRDEWERDKKLVLERMPNLREEDLEKRLLPPHPDSGLETAQSSAVPHALQ
ncbi:hypothetical protein NVS55_27265 [Myxococcus stipitatus]|uniref:hypothetical protein n=1 Tax=Myxococcus stipitatus TaxID=83455 RepID=UPI0031454919